MGRLERDFQSQLRKRLEELFPGCIILKNDPNLQQGIPDLIVLWRDKWALLEVKKSATASERPNQGWFVEKADSFSFGAFIYPENAEEVLDALQFAFRARRSTRILEREQRLLGELRPGEVRGVVTYPASGGTWDAAS